MKPYKTAAGYVGINHPAYTGESEEELKIVQESCAVGDYEDSESNSGSSFLWVGSKHHLNREEVQELINYMAHWLRTGRLLDPKEEKSIERG